MATSNRLGFGIYCRSSFNLSVKPLRSLDTFRFCNKLHISTFASICLCYCFISCILFIIAKRTNINNNVCSSLIFLEFCSYTFVVLGMSISEQLLYYLITFYHFKSSHLSHLLFFSKSSIKSLSGAYNLSHKRFSFLFIKL